MKKAYTFISKNPDTLLEMLALRKVGWTFEALAELYNCDRTSLRYQCRKYQVFPQKTTFVKNSNEVFDPKRIAAQIIIEIVPQVKSQWTLVDGEKINTGKTYAEYLRTLSPYNY